MWTRSTVTTARVPADQRGAWLEAAHIPTALHVGLGQQRASLHKLFTDLGLDTENGGILQLKEDDQAAANDFFRRRRNIAVTACKGAEKTRL